jgi:hypothetical protein
MMTRPHCKAEILPLLLNFQGKIKDLIFTFHFPGARIGSIISKRSIDEECKGGMQILGRFKTRFKTTTCIVQ